MDSGYTFPENIFDQDHTHQNQLLFQHHQHHHLQLETEIPQHSHFSIHFDDQQHFHQHADVHVQQTIDGGHVYDHDQRPLPVQESDFDCLVNMLFEKPETADDIHRFPPVHFPFDHVVPITPSGAQVTIPNCMSPSNEAKIQKQRKRKLPASDRSLLQCKEPQLPRFQQLATLNTSDSMYDSIHLIPRNFPKLVHALGGELVQNPGETVVRLAANQFPFFQPIPEMLRYVEHDRTYIMSGDVPLTDRRRHDIFSDRHISETEKAAWCDQGNAHCILDSAKPLRLAQAGGHHINPRTIQVAHALSSRVSSLLDTEKPVVKCFYFSLNRKCIRKAGNKKSRGSSDKPSPRSTKAEHYNGSLGLHKHVYVLCDQTVANRHKILEGSQVWLVRYFVKGELHDSIKDFVKVNTSERGLSRDSSSMSL